MTPVDRVLEKLPDAKKTTKGWSARCPAHEDGTASLSIAEGDDGRALVRCHAGCTVDAICGAVGLRLVDLMPDNGADVDTTWKSPGKKTVVSTSATSRSDPTYLTDKAAIEALERQHGKRSRSWTYHDVHGEPIGVIVRWDKASGKDIRPVARNGKGWIIGGMPEPRPLYRLPNLSTAKRVYVTEGEKAADAARSIGLIATTSAHGSQSPDKTDWSPLAGKEVVILPDRDEPGAKYADAVVAILAKLTPAPVVKVVEIPDLPDHGDLVDWIDAHGDAAEPEELRRQVEALADEAEAIQCDRPRDRIEHYQPFPTNVLPEPIRGFVTAGAKAIDCDPSYLALPLFCGLAGAVGATRRVVINQSWQEACILWGAIVGESGSQKTSAQEIVLRPLEDLQAWHIEQLPEKLEQYERDKMLFESDKRNWHSKGRKNGDPPPEPPSAPTVPRYIVADLTISTVSVSLDGI